MTKFIEDCNTCIIKNKEIIFPEYLQVQDGNVIVVLYSEYKILIFSQKSLQATMRQKIPLSARAKQYLRLSYE